MSTWFPTSSVRGALSASAGSKPRLALVPDIAVDINWRPYFLNPWIPREGIDRQTYLETKFGSAERYAVIAERVTAAAAMEGLVYASDKDQPAAQHARLPSPHSVVAQRHRSRAA